MSTVLPNGFVTKREATELIPLSSRQLTRHIRHAITIGDSDVLSCFALSTNDDTVTSAKEIESIETIKDLKEQGKSPSWLVQAIEYRELLNRRSNAKRQSNHEQVAVLEQQFENEQTKSEPTQEAVNFDYVKHLEKRIEQLEREKQQEVDRAEREQQRSQKREDQLNAQLVVKDKQISSWDELTQGLARGLATGQIKPTKDALTIAQSNQSSLKNDHVSFANETRDKNVSQPTSEKTVKQEHTKAAAKPKTANNKKPPKPKKAKAKSKKSDARVVSSKRSGQSKATVKKKDTEKGSKKTGFWNNLFGNS